MAVPAVSRRHYAMALVRSCLSETWGKVKQYTLIYGGATALLAALVTYLRSNEIPWRKAFTPWDWTTRPGGPDVLSGLGDSLWILLVVVAVFLLWNLLCAPYRLARQTQSPPAIEPSEMPSIVRGALEASGNRPLQIQWKGGDTEWSVSAGAPESPALHIPSGSANPSPEPPAADPPPPSDPTSPSGPQAGSPA